MFQISFHKNVESLWEHIPREVLPVEYGGYNRNLDTLRGNIYKFNFVNFYDDIP